MTETMTDAERSAAAGGHPVGNCEDCGKLHTRWDHHYDENGMAYPQSDPSAPWRHIVADLDIDPGDFIRVVVETSGDGGEPYDRCVIARGDDAVEVTGLLQRLAMGNAVELGDPVF